MDREKFIVQELMCEVKSMMWNTEVAVRSYMIVRPIFLRPNAANTSDGATPSSSPLNQLSTLPSSLSASSKPAPFLSLFPVGWRKRPAPFLSLSSRDRPCTVAAGHLEHGRPWKGSIMEGKNCSELSTLPRWSDLSMDNLYGRWTWSLGQRARWRPRQTRVMGNEISTWAGEALDFHICVEAPLHQRVEGGSSPTG
ncbi:hypothetical protein KSP40_PGU002696 [Platanthera guangdongensis]|uniref:Uncharacterized protein n=1 Tax=Platanthera guangdongensis TaxID=2320717 RepID=A0ABR2MHY9_9ASPA